MCQVYYNFCTCCKRLRHKFKNDEKCEKHEENSHKIEINSKFTGYCRDCIKEFRDLQKKRWFGGEKASWKNLNSFDTYILPQALLINVKDRGADVSTILQYVDGSECCK